MSTLLRWRTDNPSWLLEVELDGLSRDSLGNTPLHWACARGHLEIVRQLETLRTGAASIVNVAGARPADCARDHGHFNIANRFSIDDSGLSKFDAFGNNDNHDSVNITHCNDNRYLGDAECSKPSSRTFSERLLCIDLC